MARRPKNQADGTPPAVQADLLAAAVGCEINTLMSQPIPAGLYLVATPIGHLGDITLRALALIATAETVYCEDTRTSQKLLGRYGITRALKTYHEHNAARLRPEILEKITAGQSVALISDAGTPAISDPGFKLARAVIEAGGDVMPVPGPVAAVAALTISGIATDRFLFAGFLNAKSSVRRKEIEQLAAIPASLLFYEAPHRLQATLADLAACLGNRPAVVARELTKKYEECRRGQLKDLIEWAGQVQVRGEITIVVAPPLTDAKIDVSDDMIADRLRYAWLSAPPSKAAKKVAEELGVSKARVYAIGLELKRYEQ